MLVSLAPGHGPTAGYVEKIRARLASDLPQLTCFFQPADIVNQILNFGLPAPIDVQVVGKDPRNAQLAATIAQRVQQLPGAVDVHVHEVSDLPEVSIEVDRWRASSVGSTQKDVASNLLVALASSGQSSPSFWLDPKNGVSYPIAVQAPPYRISSTGELLELPVRGSSEPGGQVPLGNVATAQRAVGVANIDHFNVQQVYNIYANVAGTDLGRVTDGVNKVMASLKKDLPRGTQLKSRGQALSMQESFEGLFWGLGFAVLLIYLLLVVSYQSWSDPLIIISALPGALCGVVWMLFSTSTTFSVPSLMGTIMSLGVATANSVLVVTFANERRRSGDSGLQAALAAGVTRLRPVVMTATAMIIGMLPMALGLGEGGEQNAPLGRAVIGGLLAATVTTLVLVPTLYSLKYRSSGDADAAHPGA